MIPGDNYLYSTTLKDLTLAVWKDSTRYYLTKEEYSKANLSGAVVEGLTIVGGGESFILSLNDAQSSYLQSVETAKTLYGNIMPTAGQGKIISAKCVEINAALSNFGGTALKTSSSYSGYYTSSTTENSSGYFTNCIDLNSAYYYGELLNVKYPYIRGVTNIE